MPWRSKFKPGPAIPYRGVLDPGTLIQDFETLTGWANNGSTGAHSISMDAENFYSGSAGLKLTQGSSGLVQYQKALSPVVDLTKKELLHLYLYVYGTIASGTTFKVLFSSNGFGGGNSITYDFTAIALSTTGALHLVASKADAVQVGPPNLAALNAMIVQFNSTNANSVTVDALYAGRRSKGQIIFTFDDCNSTQDDALTNIMIPRGIKGSIVVPGSKIGTGGFMTRAQLEVFRQQGWDICNRTWSNIALDTYATQAEIEAELTMNREWLVDQGFDDRTARLVTYPTGTYDSRVLAAMANTGMICGKALATHGSGYHREIQNHALGIAQPFLWNNTGFNSALSVATMQGYVDKAYKFGSTVMLYAHNIVSSTPTGPDYLDTDYAAVVDYAIAGQAAGKWDICRWSDVLELCGFSMHPSWSW